MEKTMGILEDLTYLKMVLERCDGSVWNVDDAERTEWQEDNHLTDIGTVLMLYPSDSVSHLQVHFLVNGMVEIHRYEDHEIIARYTTKQLLSIWSDIEVPDWSDADIRELRSRVVDWLMITSFTNQT